MLNVVIHVSEMSQFEDAIYVGRANDRYGLKASPLANPYPLPRNATPEQRAECVTKYMIHFVYNLEVVGSTVLIRELIACRDRPLCCWCRRSNEEPTPNNLCHADIISDHLRKYTDDQLRAFAVTAGTRDQEGAG